jgi:hypothetical protein
VASAEPTQRAEIWGGVQELTASCLVLYEEVSMYKNKSNDEVRRRSYWRPGSSKQLARAPLASRFTGESGQCGLRTARRSCHLDRAPSVSRPQLLEERGVGGDGPCQDSQYLVQGATEKSLPTRGSRKLRQYF